MRALRWIFLLGLAGLLLSATRDVWTLDPDAAAYVSLGRSLAAGEGYELFGTPHAKYPPGLPALLAGLMQIGGPEAYQLFSMALVLCVLASALLAERLALRLGASSLAAAVIGGATGLSLTLFDLSVVYLRTETLFMALSLGALLTTLRARSSRGTWLDALLAGLLMAGALATRLAGLGLLVTPALAVLRPRFAGVRVRSLLILGLAGAFVVGWSLHGAEVREQLIDAPDYTDEFLVQEPRDLTKTIRLDNPPLDATGMLLRVKGNVLVFARASAVLLTNVDKAANQLPVGLLLAALTGLGVLRMLSRASAARSCLDAEARSVDALHDARLETSLALLASLGLLFVWPFNQQERFYVPLLPLMLLAAGEGLDFATRHLETWTRSRGGKLGALGIAALALVVLLLQRSDAPSVFGLWSKAYAALIAGAFALVALAAWRLRSGGSLRLPRHAPVLLLLLFMTTFGWQRFVRWPAMQASEQGAMSTRKGIAVHPVLREVADGLREQTEPGTVIMTDVPKMLQILADRPCVPMRYAVNPPRLVPGDASALFCTGSDPPEAGKLVESLSADWEPLLELAPIQSGSVELRPTVWRLP